MGVDSLFDTFEIPLEYIISSDRYLIAVGVSLVFSSWVSYWLFLTKGFPQGRDKLLFWSITPLIFGSFIFGVTFLRISEIRTRSTLDSQVAFDRQYWIANPHKRSGMALDLELEGMTLEEVSILLDDKPFDSSRIYFDDVSPPFKKSYIIDRRGFLTETRTWLLIWLDSNLIVDSTSMLSFME